MKAGEKDQSMEENNDSNNKEAALMEETEVDQVSDGLVSDEEVNAFDM